MSGRRGHSLPGRGDVSHLSRYQTLRMESPSIMTEWSAYDHFFFPMLARATLAKEPRGFFVSVLRHRRSSPDRDGGFDAIVGRGRVSIQYFPWAIARFRVGLA